MIFDSKFSRACHETFAVGFAMSPNEIGMGGAENDIHGVGAAFQDGRHRVDHDFDALVGREKAERQYDGSAAKAELGLRSVGLDEWEVGNPMWDDLDLFRRRPVYGAQQLPPFFSHDDDLRR